jgi:hypothetical protein
MAARAAWSEAARRELPPGETPAARGRGGSGRKDERGDYFDSRPVRQLRYWLGLWRNPLFRPRTPLNPNCADGLTGKARAASSIVLFVSVRQADHAESPRLLPFML